MATNNDTLSAPPSAQVSSTPSDGAPLLSNDRIEEEITIETQPSRGNRSQSSFERLPVSLNASINSTASAPGSSTNSSDSKSVTSNPGTQRSKNGLRTRHHKQHLRHHGSTDLTPSQTRARHEYEHFPSRKYLEFSTGAGVYGQFHTQGAIRKSPRLAAVKAGGKIGVTRQNSERSHKMQMKQQQRSLRGHPTHPLSPQSVGNLEIVGNNETGVDVGSLGSLTSPTNMALNDRSQSTDAFAAVSGAIDAMGSDRKRQGKFRTKGKKKRGDLDRGLLYQQMDDDEKGAGKQVELLPQNGKNGMSGSKGKKGMRGDRMERRERGSFDMTENDVNNKGYVQLKKESVSAMSGSEYSRETQGGRRRSLVDTIKQKMRSDMPGSDNPENRYEFSTWELANTREDRDKQEEHNLEPAFVKMVSQKRFLDDFNTLWKRAYVALILLATMIALLTFGVSQAAAFAWDQQANLYSDPSNGYSKWIPSYILELIIKIACVVAAVGTTSIFKPAAAGSGVPELRAILSGIWIKEYLGIRTFIVKIVALVFSLSTGLPIGLEGPFIHLSAILGRQLTRLSFFRHLDRKQVLSAACAGGLASVFGAPIGGVLFSIEVTSTYYAVTNYWTAFCCAVAGSTLTHVFGTLSPSSLLFYQTNFSEESHESDVYVTYELFLFGVVGLCCGLIGFIFINCHNLYVNLRRKYQARVLGTNPYGIAILVVTLFVSVMFFVGDFAIQPARRAVSDLFTISHLEDCGTKGQGEYSDCEYHDWNNRNLMLNLGLFCALNIVFAVMSTTLAYPCGVFAPVFTIGAVFGRLGGEVFREFLASKSLDPRVYAVVGAAGVAAGVTQTISPAVIALEITQELNLAVPLLLCVIIACGTSSSINVSFYDSILRLRGIPMLPIRPSEPYKRETVRKRANEDIVMSRLQSARQDLLSPRGGSANSGTNNFEDGSQMSQTSQMSQMSQVSGSSRKGSIITQTMYRLLIADDVMDKEFLFVTVEPTPDELLELLTDETYVNEWFPVVHSRSEAVLVGEVRRVVLLDYLQLVAPEVYEELSVDIRAQHASVYDGESNETIRDKASLVDPSLLSSLTPQQQNGQNGQNGQKSETMRNNGKTSGNMEQKEDGADRSKLSDDEDGLMTSEDFKSTPQIRWTLMSTGFIERLNLSPLQVISEMPLTKIYTLFHILKPQNIYVTKYSRLIGVINELHLLAKEIEMNPTISRRKLCCKK